MEFIITEVGEASTSKSNDLIEHGRERTSSQSSNSNSYSSEFTSGSEYETEEEEDNEDEYFSLLKSHDYIAEVKNTIISNEEVNLSNAIALNETFVKVLINLRSKFESLLKKCQERYVFNENRLRKLRSKPNIKFRGKRGSHYICGIPFIKNKTLKPSPANQDYLYRKCTLKEFFPVELQLYKPASWLTTDKTALVQGIKTQIIDYFKNYYSNVLIEKKLIKSIGEIDGLSRNKFPKLYEIVKDSPFKVNWQSISVYDLNSRHPAETCMAMWYGYLQPDLNRTCWTKTEEDNLTKIAKKFECQNWDRISQEIPKRSAFQCFLQYQSKLSAEAEVKNSKWTKEEDELLLSVVEQTRMGNYVPWCKVSEYIPGRNKIQVYHRYMLSLDPTIKHEKFTVEEDCLLLAAIEQYGTNFAAIPHDVLPGRTTVQLRNHFNYVLKETIKRDGKGWTCEEDKQLLEFVKNNGVKKWAEISKILKNHNRMVCRSRYNTITTYMKKHPNVKLENVPRKSRRQSTPVTRDNFIETIIKIKQGKFVPMKPKTRTKYIKKKEHLSFYDRLNKADKGLFNFFKYAFQFKYGPTITDPIYKTINMLMLSKMLKVNLCNEVIGLKSKNFSIEELSQLCEATNIKLCTDINVKFKQFEKSDVLIPLNLSNTLLLRGLTIMFPTYLEECNNSESPPSSSSSQNLDSILPAAAMFKKRLYSLLFWPTILSKLKMSSINNASGDYEGEILGEYYVDPQNEDDMDLIDLEENNDNNTNPNNEIILDENTNYTISVLRTDLEKINPTPVVTENKQISPNQRTVKRRNPFKQNCAKKIKQEK